MKYLQQDEKETSKAYMRFYVTLKAGVVADFQHQMHLEGIKPVNEASTTRAIEMLLGLYAAGRVAIVGARSASTASKPVENVYLRDHK